MSICVFEACMWSFIVLMLNYVTRNLYFFLSFTILLMQNISVHVVSLM